MLKKKRTGWIVFLIFAGLAAYICRHEAIHWVQAQLLKSLRDKAYVSNRSLLQDPSVSDHFIYTLKGMERIWPHRVNSLRRFRWLYKEFSGFECDIRFDKGSGKLFIGHDALDRPAATNPRDGVSSPDSAETPLARDVEGVLSFSDYLDSDPDHKLFWLDVKNLDSNTIGAFCDQLQRLDRQYGIRRRVVIESYDTASALRIGELGYLNALSLAGVEDTAGVEDPGPEGAPSGKSGGAPSRETAYLAAVNRLMPEKIRLLSRDINGLDRVKENFPGRKLITWDIRFFDGMNRDLLLRYANDTSLLTCLINVKSPGYR